MSGALTQFMGLASRFAPTQLTQMRSSIGNGD